MTLELHATPEEVMRAVEALQKFGQELHMPERTLFGLALALEECGSNIVNHALQRDASQTFRVTIELTGDTIVIELRDQGPEFDPTQAPVTEEEPYDDDRPPGGWGMQFVRRYTDEMRYTREGSENLLHLIKKLNPRCCGVNLNPEPQLPSCPSTSKSNRASATKRPEQSP